MPLIFRFYNNDWRELGVALNIKREWKWYLLSVIGIPIICLNQISL